MNLRRKIWIGLAVAAASLAATGGAWAEELLGVRFGPNGDATRVVFDIAGAPVYSISGVETGEGRLIVDFAGLSVGAADLSYRPGKGHIARYGFAGRSDGGVRAMFDFKKTARINKIFVLEPKDGVKKYRLVIDLQTADKQGFIASLPAQYPDLTAVIEQATATTPEVLPTPSQKEVSLPPQQDPVIEKRVVVIDPGHGGADPGAQGQSGTYEKNVTLAAALELAAILKKRGNYEVVLTRNKDAKIKPDKREALARNAGANLFVSLHADAIAARAVRGGSVYTLSTDGTARSAKLAKAEGDYNVYDLDVAAYGEEVGGIMFDLAQGATHTGSSRFAEKLLENLAGKTPLLGRSHRTGDLRVLLAPDVPAVLFEMAFISNAKDEANLNSPVWRKRTMKAVADSIDQYFEEYGEQRFAANSAGGAD
ncbi:N-acetylmuramoyl-L-alanine amidase [hydrothermal vent metagenome]|uniref:N-acetylmuramoyl-L-alanine amidase n=1 Tax=hydrothermal vent metagenome TaxID=652676 RepID=A0A3B0T7G9_9ZZZZ